LSAHQILARLRGRWPAAVITFLLLAALLNWAGLALGGLALPFVVLLDRLSSFGAVFLSIFIEAAPFLLLGSLAAGLVEEFVAREELARWMPRGVVGGALAGGLLGLFIPVCECGAVPFTRRLLGKGLPLSSAVAVLLAAPAVNPVVIASTLAAYGWGTVFWGRLLLSFLIAATTGMVFSRLVGPNILRAGVLTEGLPDKPGPPSAPQPFADRMRRVLVTGADEFFEMGRFLVIGAALAALMQTFIPQTALLSFGQGLVLPVLAMLALAVLLSVCSTVDAFVSLAFTNTFNQGAILAFLVFGPMVDIKSALMYLRLFQPRAAGVLVLVPFALSLAAGVGLNWVLR